MDDLFSVTHCTEMGSFLNASPRPPEYSCNFESDDSCNWVVEGNFLDSFSFMRVTGKEVAESGTMQFPTEDRKGDNSTHFYGAERVK